MENPTKGPRSRAPEALAIAEFVAVNDALQWVSVRGQDERNPILFLIGGPGAGLTAFTPFFAPWERDYTLVQWDQPGSATAMFKNGGACGPLSLDGLARDGVAVIEHVLARTGARKLILLCMSAGTMVGLKIAKARPDLVAAYVGSGQFVDWRRQDALSYEMILRAARESADTAAIKELEALGPPPYKDTSSDAIKSKYAGALTSAERAEFAALSPQVAQVLQSPPADADYLPPDLPPLDPRAAATAAYDEMREEIVHFDARRVATKFEVPMFFFQGEHDAFSVTSEVAAYAKEITAPVSRVVIVEAGGHSCLFLRERILTLLNQHVRPHVGP